LALYLSRVRSSEVLGRTIVRCRSGEAIDDAVACSQNLVFRLLRVPRDLNVSFGQGFGTPLGAYGTKRKIVDLGCYCSEHDEVGIYAPIRHDIVRQGGKRKASLKNAKVTRDDCASLSNRLALGSGFR
jgi:hypothetical protein